MLGRVAELAAGLADVDSAVGQEQVQPLWRERRLAPGETGERRRQQRRGAARAAGRGIFM